MKIRKGFTLIELLVVIAIVSLLLSILVPALRKAKEMAMATICQSRLKQWQPIVELFALDNDGKFPSSDFNQDGNSDGHGHWWIQALRPYYQDAEIRRCPKATLPPPEAFWSISRKPTEAWASPNPFPELEPSITINGTACILGSYGPNGWLIDTSSGSAFSKTGEDRFWKRKSAVKQPWSVPLFMDCFWVDGWPTDEDMPQSDYDNMGTWDISQNPMQRFNIVRHNKYVNGVFMDGTIRKVALKELWQLKWHRTFNTGNSWTRPGATWPDWMQ